MSNGWSKIRGSCLILVLLLGSCHAKRVAFLADLKMGDISADRQLIGGFYQIEQNQWRWAARRFAVVLSPPPGSKRAGGILRLHFFIPNSQIAALGPITLSAEIENSALPPETFIKGGAYTYSRSVPAAAFRGSLLPVVFSLDKGIGRSEADPRELGAVVTEVSLEGNQ